MDLDSYSEYKTSALDILDEVEAALATKTLSTFNGYKFDMRNHEHRDMFRSLLGTISNSTFDQNHGTMQAVITLIDDHGYVDIAHFLAYQLIDTEGDGS